RNPSVCGEPLDAAILLRRRRRVADRAAAGLLAPGDRARPHRRRAAGDRRHPERLALSRRAARARGARLRMRELRRAAAPARPGADRLEWACESTRLSDAARVV